MTWSSRDELGRLLRRYADAVVAADRAITNFRVADAIDRRIASVHMSETAKHADAMYATILDRYSVPPPSTAVCDRCRDTNRMELADGTVVPCTACPVPCPTCRRGGVSGAYCAATPCACECHPKRNP